MFPHNRKSLRRNEAGALDVGEVVSVIIGVLITAIIGFALFATFLSSVAGVNATSKYGPGSQIPGLLNLSPLLFALAIVLIPVAGLFVVLYMATKEARGHA